MRVAICFMVAGLCALAMASAVPTTAKGQVADKDFLQKQKNILRLYFHINQPNTFKDQTEIAKTFNIEEYLDHYTNPQAVKEFVYLYRQGYLPRGEVFSIFNEVHRHQAVALFHVFYYAKDYDTFYKSAVWARDYINEPMYEYALTVAILHRPDTQGIVLPAPYEVYPYYYFNSEVIQKAYEYKMRNFAHVPYASENQYIIPANYSGWYLQYDNEQKMSYFTEDIGLNSYYYYFHADYPFWMGGEEYGLKKDRRGELYYYFHQQILARYYLERLSNDLGHIPNVDYHHPVQHGYYPSLRYQNGLDFPSRPYKGYYVRDGYTQYYAEEIDSMEGRIRDAIDSGYVYTEDGTKVSLYDAQGIDYLGNLVNGNPDSVNKRFYGYLHVFAHMLYGYTGQPHSDYHLYPSALEHYQTALRDPVFYQLYKKIMYYFFFKYQKQLPYYTYDQLNFPGVKIESVNVEKLYTYFDYFDSDITNVLYTDMTKEVDTEEYSVKARQYRLNHKPFTYQINVASDKAVQAVVRVFLGPKYDEYGNEMDFNENRYNFVELDKFHYDIAAGKNVIERNSRESYHTVKDRTTYKVLYQKVMNAILGQEDFLLDQSEAHCGFPNRLILPKGKKGGQEFQFYVHISPYKPSPQGDKTAYNDAYSCGVASGARYFDAYPFGYPLDRPVNKAYFYTPNSYFQDVVIFHKTVEDINSAVHY